MFVDVMYAWVIGVITLVAICIIAIRKYLGRKDDYWKKKGVPYQPTMSVFKLMKLIRDKPIHEVQLEYYKKYGRIFGSAFFGQVSLQVSDPELIKDIFVKDFHIFHFRRDVASGDPITDKMVTGLKGDDWKRVRTIITPAFTSKRMRKIGSIINDCSKTVLETFEKHYNKGEPVDCKRIFGAFTMDVIASAAFATKIDSLNDPNNIFVKTVKDVFLEISPLRLLILLVCPTWILRKLRVFGFKQIDFFKSFTIDIIKERKRSNKKYNDFLQLLMEAAEETAKESANEKLEDEVDQFGSITSTEFTASPKYKSLSENEILAQCILFFIVGYETTATVLSFLSYALALNPKWQDKLISEVDQTLQKEKEWSYDAVREMKVLDNILSETLRMYPPATITERTADEDYKLGDTGIIIEKGVHVAIPIYSMHYDSEFFEEPNTFNPDRFADPNSFNKYAYLPFGAGPRNCLGMRFAIMEIKLCICNVLQHYKFKLAPTTKVPLEFKKGFGLLSVSELPLAIEKRNKTK